MDSVPGRRLVVHEIDRRARVQPDKLCAMYSDDDSLSEKSWRKVTMSDFAKAIDRTCAFLEPIIGKSSSFDTQAYFGPPDMRYHFFQYACIKLGHKALYSAPRNSPEMHQHIFKSAGCQRIFYSSNLDMNDLLGEAADGISMHTFPTLDEMLWAKDKPKHYTYNKTFEEARWDPYLVLHTSGSTGMPKPIVHRHGWFASVDLLAHAEPVNGHRCTMTLTSEDKRIYAAFPPWHVSGSELVPAAQLSGGSVWVWGPTDRLPSVKDVLACVEHGEVQQVGLPAQLYKDVVNSEAGEAMLKGQEILFFGGGPMDAELGDRLSKLSRVVGLYGTTECGWIGVPLETAPEDWAYQHFAPDPALSFREITPGVYELAITRDPSPFYPPIEGASKGGNSHPVWYTAPDADEWPTKDLWHAHPTKPNHWFYEGRADDLIVFYGGAKFNPLGMEEQLRTNPLVRSAIVCGTGRCQTALLLELDANAKTGMTDEEALERVWPTLDRANERAPKHARVQRSHVILKDEEVGWCITAKGTVQRAPTVRLYADRLDEVYRRAGDVKPKEGVLAGVTAERPRRAAEGHVCVPAVVGQDLVACLDGACLGKKNDTRGWKRVAKRDSAVSMAGGDVGDAGPR